MHFFIGKVETPRKENNMNDKALYCVIDLKSFYASCECAARGLDPFKAPLVVCDPTRGPSTIVMSSTPYLKANYKIPNVCRRRDLPQLKDMIYAQPRMAYYIEMSSRVVSIFMDRVAEEDIHVYSIDESFLNIGPYLSLAKQTPEEFVHEIQKQIYEELGLTATAGIGPNMFLAKIALDNEGKKRPPYIAHWTEKDVPTKLWSISPITEIWGISRGTEAHLKRIGIRSMKELAHCDRGFLEEEFGVMGLQLHDLANGIDRTDIREKYIPKESNLSIGQTLSKDYSISGAKLLLREMCDDLASRMRSHQKRANVVSLFVGYSAATGGGFSRQKKLEKPSDDNDTLYRTILEIFDSFIESFPIRNLGISFGKLSDIASAEQLDLFEPYSLTLEKRNLNRTLDEIKRRYGQNACLRSSCLLPDSTIIERHGQIGGHKA